MVAAPSVRAFLAVLAVAACSGRPGRGGDDDDAAAGADADADADADTDTDADIDADPDPDADPDADPDTDPDPDTDDPPPDAGPAIPEPSAGIACSNVTCDPGSERCCIETAVHHECRPRHFDCPFEWADRECDGPEDCPDAGACCFDAIDARGPAQCRADCLEAQIELCHGPEDCRFADASCCFPPGRPAGFCRTEDWPAVECLP